MECYSMLKSKQGKQGEKEVYELRTFVYKLLCKFKSKSRELCEDEFCRAWWCNNYAKNSCIQILVISSLDRLELLWFFIIRFIINGSPHNKRAKEVSQTIDIIVPTIWQFSIFSTSYSFCVPFWIIKFLQWFSK
jgi:hypothetical protein